MVRVHPCLVPFLREKAFSLSLLGMMLAVSLLYMSFITLQYVPLAFESECGVAVVQTPHVDSL